MGLLADAWTWFDANVAGGLLPGGHPVLEPGATLGGVIPTPFVGIQPQAPVAPGVVQPPVAGFPAMGGQAAMRAAMGMPVAAAMPPGAPRGKTITAEARVFPDGTIIPVRMRPGRPLVMSTDLQIVKRMKKVSRKLARAFPAAPRRRRHYHSRARKTSKK